MARQRPGALHHAPASWNAVVLYRFLRAGGAVQVSLAEENLPCDRSKSARGLTHSKTWRSSDGAGRRNHCAAPGVSHAAGAARSSGAVEGSWRAARASFPGVTPSSLAEAMYSGAAGVIFRPARASWSTVEGSFPAAALSFVTEQDRH